MAYNETLESLLRKNKQEQIAGMTGASKMEQAGYVEGAAKGEAERRNLARTNKMIEESNAANIAVQREGFNTQREINAARMQQEREQFDAETARNEKQYDETMRDTRKQREISGTVSGAMAGAEIGGTYGGWLGAGVGGVVGAGVGYTASGGWDDMTKINKQAGLLSVGALTGLPNPKAEAAFKNPDENQFENMASMATGGVSSSTVICTELYRQGYITQIQLSLENVWINKYMDNTIYTGYRAWADWVVKGMKKSKTFSNFVALFGKAFVQECNHYAAPSTYKCNILGKIVIHIGIPICRLIGQCSSHQLRMEVV